MLTSEIFSLPLPGGGVGFGASTRCLWGAAGTPSTLHLIPASRSRRILTIYCKRRRKSSSSPLKKQHSKSISHGKSPSDSKYSSNNDKTRGFRTHEIISSSFQVPIGTESPGASAYMGTEEKCPDEFLPLDVDKVVPGGTHYSNDLVSSIHLLNLVDMIKNVERNVLLLNGARVHAIEQLDKVRSEKDLLEIELNILQMELGRYSVYNTMRENICFKIVEDNGKELKDYPSVETEDLGPHLYADGNGALDMETHYFEKSSLSSLAKGLESLRDENILLKDEIQALKMKLSEARETSGKVISLEKERARMVASLKEMDSRLSACQEDMSEVCVLKSNCNNLLEKIKSSNKLLDSARKQAEKGAGAFSHYNELQTKIKELEASLEETKGDKLLLDKTREDNELLQNKARNLEIQLQKAEEEINSHVYLYQVAVKEFQEMLERLKGELKKKSQKVSAEDAPDEFWSGLFLMIDGWLLERKISPNDAKILREMALKRDSRIHYAYSSCEGKSGDIVLVTLLKIISSPRSLGMHIVHIAAEMAPVSKVGGLGDVVSGISKALQKRGHLVEVILPKYDCMNHEHIDDMKMLDAEILSYFDGRLYKSRIWVGTVEGLPVYFIDPQHPARFFTRGKLYGEHDDFKRYAFFSRAALELLYQGEKHADIIHCHDWHTAFIAPLYWDIYAARGFNSTRICFTCHNFEYQGVVPASELVSSGLNIHHMNRKDRLQDNSSRDRINLVKGAIVFSNIVTTVSPTYAQEVCTPEGGRGLHQTLQLHSRKFVGILNGIDCETWNPSTDIFIRFHYCANDILGKVKNKVAIRKQLKLSSDVPSKPLVCCITRLVPQKGVHLIRHAIHRTTELGGQFVLLGSSPVPHIQREFEDISNQFQSHPDIRLLLRYDEALSHVLYAASDMIVIPSIFEPCGLTQMIAMKYGTVPISRRTGGLNDSVFDVEDDAVPMQHRNGFVFLSPDEQGLNNAMERAFKLYTASPDVWKQLVCRIMEIDFSWDTSSLQYEEVYEREIARAKLKS